MLSIHTLAQNSRSCSSLTLTLTLNKYLTLDSNQEITVFETAAFSILASKACKLNFNDSYSKRTPLLFTHPHSQ